MKLSSELIPIQDLLFDPNNYRFQDLPKYRVVDKSRLHEDRVQEEAYKRLRDVDNFEVEILKESIKSNGLVPLERIVVTKYSDKPEKWLVIEGNRRLAAIKWLIEDHNSAVVSLSKDQLGELKEVDCLT